MYLKQKTNIKVGSSYGWQRSYSVSLIALLAVFISVFIPTFTIATAATSSPATIHSIAPAPIKTAPHLSQNYAGYAWGNNDSGQLGNLTAGSVSTTPVQIAFPAGVTPITMSLGTILEKDNNVIINPHALAIGSDGNLYSWGDDEVGEIGNGTISSTPVTTPITVNFPASGVTATAIAAGGGFSLAIGSNGDVYAWGDNVYGELGQNNLNSSSVPLTVTLPNGVSATAIAAGEATAYVIGSDHHTYIWGYTYDGELGNGLNPYEEIKPIQADPLGSGVYPIAIAAGNTHAIAIGSNNAVYAWGYVDSYHLPGGTAGTSTLPNGVNPVAVAAGYLHDLILGSDGKVYASGDNSVGQLGSSNGIVTLAPNVRAVAIAAGYAHSLAIGNDGNVYAWGANSFGELGNGNQNQQNTPTVITNVTAVTAIFGGYYESAMIGNYGQSAITTTTMLASSLNPSLFGQGVTFTATVSPAGASGTLTFTIDNSAVYTTTLDGSSNLATYFTDTLSVGDHAVSALFSNGDSYLSSSDSLTQTVNSQPVTTTATTTEATTTASTTAESTTTSTTPTVTDTTPTVTDTTPTPTDTTPATTNTPTDTTTTATTPTVTDTTTATATAPTVTDTTPTVTTTASTPTDTTVTTAEPTTTATTNPTATTTAISTMPTSPTVSTPVPTTNTPVPTTTNAPTSTSTVQTTTATPTATTPIVTNGNTYNYYLPFLANSAGGANVVRVLGLTINNSKYSTFVSLDNSGGSPANFTITYYDAQGNIIGTDNNGGNTLAPNNVYQPSQTLPNGQSGAATITSDQPLNILVSESGTVNGQTVASVYKGLDISSDANSTIYAPIALNNSYGGYTTSFILMNTGSSLTNATIQYYSDSGQSAGSQNVTLAAHSQTSVAQNSGANLPSGFSGWAIITNTNNQELVGQVVETNPNFGFLETVNMPGTSGKTLLIPTVFQNAFGNFNTGMQLVNPNGTAANVTVTYYRKDGTKITAGNNHGNFSIAANSDKSFYHDTADFPELNTANGGFVGTAIVSSDQPLVAIVNQSGSLGGVQYNGAFGTLFSGASRVSLPAVVKNAYGYTSGLQVSNVSGIASTATITYYDTKGNQICSTTLHSDTGGAIPAYGSVNPYLGVESNLPANFSGVAVVTADTVGAQFVVIANNASSQFFYTYANND